MLRIGPRDEGTAIAEEQGVCHLMRQRDRKGFCELLQLARVQIADQQNRVT
jgi:hypothetical protein